MAQAPDPRRHARTKAAAADEAAETVLIVGYGSTMWALRHDDIAPRDVADMREVVHFGLADAFKALSDNEIEVDHAAALIFLARRQQTPRITFDAATDGLKLGTGFTVGVGSVDDYPPR